MHTARSATSAARDSRSASDTATTLSIPASAHARTIRTAISPRWATSPRRTPFPAGGLEGEERIPVLAHLAVLGVPPHHRARHARADVVHQLHHLDDADGVV